MYKVLLIDDDVPMLDYVRQLIDWEALRLEPAGATHSSELALDLFRGTMPDLVVTDIGLPVMDGIELARQFRALKPDVRIIFLTCYEDVAYLKQAFHLEADDYLIKDELSPQKLEEALRKSLRWLKGKEESLERHKFRQDIQRNKDVLKQKFFEQIVRGAVGEETMLFGERLHIRWPHERFALALVRIDLGSAFERYACSDIPLLQYAVYNIAEELAGERGTITAFLSGEEHVWLVFNEPAGLAAERSAQRCDEFAAQVADKAKQFLKIDLFVVSAGATSDLKRIGALHRSATEGLASSYYSEAFRIRLPVPSAAYVQPNAAEFGKEQGIALQAFRDGNPSLLDIAVGGIKTKACRESYDPLAVIGAFEDIVRQAAAEYRLPPSPAFFALMQRTARIGETVRMARRQLREMLQHAGSAAPGGREDHDLGKINRYIEEHICEMVTSVDVANYLHLNSSYFSRLFKRRTGVNFTEYVHQYKMKLAKSLLARPDETVENVAYTLGYSDRAYFSKVFKKYTGMNPSDYKHSQIP